MSSELKLQKVCNLHLSPRLKKKKDALFIQILNLYLGLNCLVHLSRVCQFKKHSSGPLELT